MRLKCLNTFLFLIVVETCIQAQFNEKVFDNRSPKQENRVLYGYNRFRDKLPFDVKDSLVTFFLKGFAGGKRVFLSGNFNNWAPDALPMVKKDSGWIALVKLAKGKYLYKFIIDGNWNIDDDNLSIEKDDQGNINSVYYKTNVVFKLQGFSNTKNVWLAASFNNWGATELALNKAESGWEIPLYLSDGRFAYKFKTDHEWHGDPANSNRFPGKSGGFNSVVNVGNLPAVKDFAYYQNELAINEEVGDKQKIADDLINLGINYMKMHDYPNAIQMYQRVIISYEKSKNHSGTADMLINIADVYRESSDFSHLLEYLQKATREYEKAGNVYGLAKTLRSTGYYYLNYSTVRISAVPYFHQSLALYKQLGKQKEVAYVLGDLGHSYLLIRDTANAFGYLEQALSLSQKIGNKEGMAKYYGLLGDYYFRMPVDIPRSLDCFQKSLLLFEETGNKIGVGQVLINLADLYIYAPDSSLKKAGIPPSEKYAMAIVNLKKGNTVFKELLPESEQLYPLPMISDTYEKMGNFDSAYVYYRQYIAIRDKVLSTDKQKEVTRLETKYEYEKKEDSLKLQQGLTDEKLQKQLLFARQQQQQIELNLSQLALTNSEKDLQHLAYLKMQGDLVNEQLIKQQKEKENQLQAAQVKSLTQRNAIIRQRQWIYIVGGSVLLLLGFLYFIYRSRLRSVRLESQLIKEKAEKEKKEIEFQHKLADISMSALRSQMNPHFIFNCLNSIKLYTTENDAEAASRYLGKFSKLIRLVLDNSRNERITFSSELAALELYIQMEAMRFKERLSYSLEVEDDVETNCIEIPPLLLQPYVENAIWHGLMARDTGGHIAIAAKMKDESLLEINITDNGIGRTAAMAVRDKKSNYHKSYGMKATTERIALINQIYKGGANVFVNDLADEKGAPTGTQVIIQIPV